MVPPLVTEDYYNILGVEPTATTQLIVTSYRRLALKLHPDKNANHDATDAFQKLVRAYETLHDESKRRVYDLIYPSIIRNRPSQNTPTPRPAPASTSQSEARREAEQIAAIQKSKQDRSAKWWTKKIAFDSLIFELKRHIWRLEREIKDIESISATEAAEEAQKNSWGAWFFSAIYKRAEDTKEEKERKDRKRQERRIEKDMKERRLETNKAEVKKQENLLKLAEEEVRVADQGDDSKIREIQHRIWVRENLERREKQRQERERQERERQERERQERERQERERQEKERQEKERQEKERQERERQERERQERERQERERQERESQERERQERERLETMARFQKQQQENWEWEEEKRRKQQMEESTSQAYTSTCGHNGWWPKVQGRTECPLCCESWTYLPKCPGCMMKACPRCQAGIRKERKNRRAYNRPYARTFSPFDDDFNW